MSNGSKVIDLNGLISKVGLYALNHSSDSSPENAIFRTTPAGCKGDSDNQMIIHVPFTQAVRLYSIAVDAPEGSRPTCIKLFANKPISFDDVDVMTPAQILNLKEEEFGDDVQIRLNMAKLGTVHSINVFFENENGELVAVKYLSFFGYPVQGTNISELKPMKDA